MARQDIYSREWKVLSSDADMHRRLRWSAMFTCLQEAAIAHTELLGAGRDKTLDRGLLWIVTQQYVSVKRMPVYDERVTLLSWPGKTMHLFFPRYWRMMDETGEELFRASSLWALMDKRSRKMVFPEEYGISVKEDEAAETFALPRRVKPQENTSAAGAFTVPYSCIDLNGHMNNARYFDLASDHLPEEFREREAFEVQAEYAGEVRPGDRLSLHTFRGEDSWYFSGGSDRDLFRMCFHFH